MWRGKMEPIIKWAGGKRKLAEEIIYLFPDDYRDRRYHEPMLGGGAIFFHIEPAGGTVNDRNPHLMRFYRAVRDNPDDLISKTREHRYEDAYYYLARARYNRDDTLTDIERASLFLYFNKTAFNGLWRVNADGDFNVPIGGYTDPTIVDEDAIFRASRLLQNVDLFEADFNYLLKVAEEGDIVYIDPPYRPVSDTASFTSYTKDGFDENDQRRLHQLCLELDKMGVAIVLSNSDAKPIRDLYNGTAGFRIKVVTARRYINCDGGGRGPVKELLIHNT